MFEINPMNHGSEWPNLQREKYDQKAPHHTQIDFILGRREEAVNLKAEALIKYIVNGNMLHPNWETKMCVN